MMIYQRFMITVERKLQPLQNLTNKVTDPYRERVTHRKETLNERNA